MRLSERRDCRRLRLTNLGRVAELGSFPGIVSLWVFTTIISARRGTTWLKSLKRTAMKVSTAIIDSFKASITAPVLSGRSYRFII